MTISGANGLPEIVYAMAMKVGDRRKAMDIMLAKQGFFAAEWARIQETRS